MINNLTAERLHEILHYDPETGVFTWLVRPAQCIRAGDTAGTKNGNGYNTILVAGCRYQAHRDLDHANMNKADNRWENLREATRSRNLANSYRSMGRLKGAYRHPGKWQAKIIVEGKNYYLGSFAAREEAALAYATVAYALYGEFADMRGVASC